MRSKSLVCEIESVYDERQEQMAENCATSGPHLSFSFPVRITPLPLPPPPPSPPLPLLLHSLSSLALTLPLSFLLHDIYHLTHFFLLPSLLLLSLPPSLPPSLSPSFSPSLSPSLPPSLPLSSSFPLLPLVRTACIC